MRSPSHLVETPMLNEPLYVDYSNRRLDNKLNIFESIHRNIFFIIINIIMIGGQVLIIFVGGESFMIVRLDGMEWGLSIGLGALSLPWGALIRLFPDHWLAAMLPWFIRDKWHRRPYRINTEKTIALKPKEYIRLCEP